MRAAEQPLENFLRSILQTLDPEAAFSSSPLVPGERDSCRRRERSSVHQIPICATYPARTLSCPHLMQIIDDCGDEY
jgi:hypothetical protein